MGLRRAFTNADFSKIAPEPLTVTKVIQKAYLEVNEKGSEAASATSKINIKFNTLTTEIL